MQLSGSLPDAERIARYVSNAKADSSQLDDIDLELKLFEGQTSQVEPRNKYRDSATLEDKRDAARKLTKQINVSTLLKKPLQPVGNQAKHANLGGPLDSVAQRKAVIDTLSSSNLQYRDLFFAARGVNRLFHNHGDLWKILHQTILRELKLRNSGSQFKPGVKYLQMAISIYNQSVSEEDPVLQTAFKRFMDVQYHTLDILSKWQICETFTLS